METWSKASKLNSPLRFTLEDFVETLDGGQAFTWHKMPDKHGFAEAFEGFFSDIAARIFLSESGEVFASFPCCTNSKNSEARLIEYLDGYRDYESLRAELPSRSDKIIEQSLKARPTLRILKQTPREALISFICSSSKRIVQIKQCVGLLAQNLGEPISGGVFSAIPTIEAIDDAPLEVIKSCKLGFRADYLKKSVRKILEDKFDIDSLPQMPYEDAKKYLLSLSGIGEKVADCILLFGAAKFEAFPVDTWIKKAMCDMYNLSDPNEIRCFARSHFGKYGGYAQQLIFAKARNDKSK